MPSDSIFGEPGILQVSVDMGINLNLPYRESGNKTILHLALEEDDGEPYVDALLAVSKI